VGGVSAQSAHSSSSGSPKVAFTFDDLPAHGALPPGTTREEIASKILAAFHEQHMPPVYGFVNGAAIEKNPGDIEVLKMWHDAGNPLGNHTWSHVHLTGTNLQAYEDEITKNESTISAIMKNEDWHWFRYPFLDEGEAPEKRDQIRAFLVSRGYKIAAVSMSFGDYMWNEPYSRCSTKNDHAAIEVLKKSYLTAADESITRYRSMSQKLYGRDLAYVLLMHIGALDAEMIPQLLRLYRSRGFEFVTLPAAEKDEFYRADRDPHLPVGPESLEQAMREKGLPIPEAPTALPKFDSMCR
jgi:peptidoglycan/xylan/chitin deacetylase (PgdA/CDA1 family)